MDVSVFVRVPRYWLSSLPCNSDFKLFRFVSAISAASSLNSLNSYSCPPIIDFYDPIITQQYPDPVGYDLIILSGGTADPMGHDPWVLKLQKFLRKTVN